MIKKGVTRNETRELTGSDLSEPSKPRVDLYLSSIGCEIGVPGRSQAEDPPDVTFPKSLSGCLDMQRPQEWSLGKLR